MITINVPSITINLPASNDEVTPEQRSDFAALYGHELARKLTAIRGLPPGFEQDLAMIEFMIEASTCRFSFFSGISLKQLKDTPGMVDTIAQLTLLDLPELVEDLMKPQVLAEYYSLS